MKPLQRPYTPRQTARNDGTAPGRGPSTPDVWDDRLPLLQENGLKKRAIIENVATSPWKEAMTAARKGESGRENVDSRCRSSEAMGNARVRTHRHAHGRLEAKRWQEPA